MAFEDYVKTILKDWKQNPDKVEAELERYRYAIRRDLSGSNSEKWQAALEALQINIEDECFWRQLLLMNEIELPK